MESHFYSQSVLNQVPRNHKFLLKHKQVHNIFVDFQYLLTFTYKKVKPLLFIFFPDTHTFNTFLFLDMVTFTLAIHKSVICDLCP